MYKFSKKYSFAKTNAILICIYIYNYIMFKNIKLILTKLHFLQMSYKIKHNLGLHHIIYTLYKK